MTWCNNPDDDARAIKLVAAATKEPSLAVAATSAASYTKIHEIQTIICPSCGFNIPYQDQVLHVLNPNVIVLLEYYSIWFDPLKYYDLFWG